MWKQDLSLFTRRLGSLFESCCNSCRFLPRGSFPLLRENPSQVGQAPAAADLDNMIYMNMKQTRVELDSHTKPVWKRNKPPIGLLSWKSNMGTLLFNNKFTKQKRNYKIAGIPKGFHCQQKEKTRKNPLGKMLCWGEERIVALPLLHIREPPFQRCLVKRLGYSLVGLSLEADYLGEQNSSILTS